MNYLVGAVPFILFSTGILAQELPSEEDLANRVSLPGFWEIQDFRIIAQAMVGTPIEPRAQIRFEADSSPLGDLFTESGTEGLGPFVTVVASTSDDTVRTLYGTMDLNYAAGQWNGPVNIENPVDGLGRPLDSFTVPTLVLGSERQVEVAESLRSAAAADLRIALEADRQRLREAHAAEIERMRGEHLSTLSALKQDHAAARAELDEMMAAVDAEAGRVEAEIEERRARALAGLAEQLEAEKRKHAAELDELQGAHDGEVRELKASQSELIGAVVTAHLEELQSLETEHARATGALVAKQEREMAELTTKLDTRKESLEAQIETADEVLALQSALTARQTAIGVNDGAIRAAEEQRQVEFGKSLDGLVGIWTGTAACDIGNGPQTFNMSFSWGEITGRSLVGTIQNKSISGAWGREVSANLHFTGNDLTLPLPLKLVTNSRNGLGTQDVDLELQSDGWMVGKSSDEVCSEIRVSKS